MPEKSYRDPLTSQERREFEDDLISFCELQLALLDDIRGLDVLYAGGSSLLWIEGISQRVGESGSLTVLDLDEDALRITQKNLTEAELQSPVKLVVGDVFEQPFDDENFDLAYTAGLFHELNVGAKAVEVAFKELVRVVKRGGRVVTTDFVSSEPATQLEDERLQAELANELLGYRLYGIGSPGRLVELHERFLKGVSWRVLEPYHLRHFGKIVVAEKDLEEADMLPTDKKDAWHEKRKALLERILREGYTRPATLYVEGRTAGN